MAGGWKTCPCLDVRGSTARSTCSWRSSPPPGCTSTGRGPGYRARRGDGADRGGRGAGAARRRGQRDAGPGAAPGRPRDGRGHRPARARTRPAPPAPTCFWTPPCRPPPACSSSWPSGMTAPPSPPRRSRPGATAGLTSAAAELGKATEALHGLIELAEMTGRSGRTGKTDLNHGGDRVADRVTAWLVHAAGGEGADDRPLARGRFVGRDLDLVRGHPSALSPCWAFRPTTVPTGVVHAQADDLRAAVEDASGDSVAVWRCHTATSWSAPFGLPFENRQA